MPSNLDSRCDLLFILQLVPLGRQKPISSAEFMKKLQKEAEDQRKAKKRNTTSGIHKYASTYISTDFTIMSLSKRAHKSSWESIACSSYPEIVTNPKRMLGAEDISVQL